MLSFSKEKLKFSAKKGETGAGRQTMLSMLPMFRSGVALFLLYAMQKLRFDFSKQGFDPRKAMTYFKESTKFVVILRLFVFNISFCFINSPNGIKSLTSVSSKAFDLTHFKGKKGCLQDVFQ